jgi:hypothetical protein
MNSWSTSTFQWRSLCAEISCLWVGFHIKMVCTKAWLFGMYLAVRKELAEQFGLRLCEPLLREQFENSFLER